MRGHNLERSSIWHTVRRATLAWRHFPTNNGVSLPGGGTARCFPVPKVKQTGLHSVIGLDSQRVVIVPSDVQSRRRAHQPGCAVGSTFLVGCFVLLRIPGIAHLFGGGGDRDAGVIALGRSYHALQPVLSHNCNPVASTIYRRRCLRGPRSGLGFHANRRENACTYEEGPQTATGSLHTEVYLHWIEFRVNHSDHFLAVRLSYNASTNMSVVHGPLSVPYLVRKAFVGFAAFTCASVMPCFIRL